MSPGEVLTAFAALMTVIGVPVGILFREVIRSKDHQIEACRADCAREIEALQAAHLRELIDRDRQIEGLNVTESRLIEMALRSTAAGERVALTAEKVIGRTR